MNKKHLHIIQKLKQQPRQGSLPDEIAALGQLMTATISAGAQLNSINEQLVGGIGSLRQSVQKLSDQYNTQAKETQFLSEENAGLAKNYGLTIGEAVRLNAELQKNAKNFKVGGDALRSYTLSMKGLLGQFATIPGLIRDDYGKTLFEANEIMQENLQLSGEQANKFTMFAALQGETATEALVQQKYIADAIDKATGQQGNFRQIVEDIAALSEDVQLQYAKIPGDLALAATKARALGFSMSDLHKTGKQLLNIESSIGDELEYQLLSGRRLVDGNQKSLTNAYREATLQREGTKQADTLLTILQQEGETLENNLFAREQMSKLLGLDEAALSRALGKKKILEEIGGEALFNLSGKELFKAAEDLGASATQLEELRQQEDVRTIDQKMLAGQDKMISILMAGLLGDPDAYKSLIEDQQKEQLAAQQGQINATQNLADNISPALTQFAGAKFTSARSIGAMAATPLDLINSFSNMTIKTINLYPAEVVSNGGGNFAKGGVIPPGYPNDTYPAMLTSGETVIPAGQSPNAGMATFAAMIVSAINRQTDALTNNSGINAPYWS